MKTVYEMRGSLSGGAYQQLIRWGTSSCSRAMVVARDGEELSAAGRATLAKLSPFLAAQRTASEWPGTQLFEDTATLFEYEVSEALGDVLIAVAHGLFDWQHPDRPEDLAFLSASGEAVFLSITHEEVAYFRLSEWEYGALVAKAPLLRPRLKVTELTDLEFEGDGFAEPGDLSREEDSD